MGHTDPSELGAYSNRCQEHLSRKTAVCSNTKLNVNNQISIGLRLHADDLNGFYPVSGDSLHWDLIDKQTQKEAWTQQLLPYVGTTNIYRCPNDRQTHFSYFNGTRAAYIAAGSNYTAVDSKKVQFPVAYVLSGDTVGLRFFQPDDADKDDYTQNCVGGATNGMPAVDWQAHHKGQNILFDDGHAKWYKGYSPSEMTFRYEAIHGWQ